MAALSDNEIKNIFATNLRRIMEERGIDGAALSRMIGTEKQSVYAWLSESSFPSANNLQRLVEKLDVTTDELLARDGGGTGFVDVPLFGSIAAGTPIDMMPVTDTMQVPRALHNKYPRAFYLKVDGESMNRILPNGCYALVDPCSEVTADMAPYAVCVNGYAATVKRVRKLAHGFQLVPDSTDPTYRPKTYDYNDPSTETITIIGRVVYYMLPFDWSF